MSGYVFISNSNKPSETEQKSRQPILISNVSRPCLQIAMEMGFDVILGVNRENPDGLKCELPVKLYDSHTYRSIIAFRDNYIAYKNLIQVLSDENVEVIHCNTPVGGLIGRICGKRKKVKKIIYTAHGFHFYKGAPFFNRTVIKFAEKIMAHWTDAIITMNKEDFEAAKKFKLKKGGKVYYIPGVGIDTTDFLKIEVNRYELRKTLNIPQEAIVCISMGDLVLRKNYAVAIKAIARCKNRNLHYLICGCGAELENLKRLSAEQGLSQQIHFLGFRKDVKELLKISDIFLFTTLQEGLPRSMMEAMASGLPCVASKVRGNTDLLEDGVGGFLCDPNDIGSFAEKIKILADNADIRAKQAFSNLERIKNFDIAIVKEKMKKIYQDILN